MRFICFKAATTSKYNGSPVAPISFVRSKTAILFTVAGKTETRCLAEKGRYKWTLTRPTFLPFAVKASTTSFAVSVTDPIAMMTSVAFSAP